ncbi:hypothetical protein HanXRQr2_Chr03g0092001 [Helianthus annuus]|uniref:Uncharacterized protein n=1 Tax=Helianthus annuus TaxID=4232 RepID=A0A9K3JDG8_HELAN|nr:hypothetical protein HanXRQr2_Chr03g0092001 [Helianthus annuus]
MIKTPDIEFDGMDVNALTVVVEWLWKDLIFIVTQVRLPLSLLFSAASR